MALNSYRIQHRVHTLSENALMNEEGNPTGFDVGYIHFENWEFSHMEGFTGKAWIASAVIEAENFREAFNIFRRELSRTVSRIAVVSQCYTEYLNQSFIIHKIGSDIAFFRETGEEEAVGLMFMEKEQEALGMLMEDKTIPDTFYYYWNEAVNASGYSSKLSIMFSALDVLVKVKTSRGSSKDWELVNLILGTELTAELFGTKENPSVGLRHRLVHGDYFNAKDAGKNYFELVHNKMMEYFNKHIFKKELLHSGVTNPQRHPFGNMYEYRSFIQLKNSRKDFNLKDLIRDTTKNSFRSPETFTYDIDDSLTKYY